MNFDLQKEIEEAIDEVEFGIKKYDFHVHEQSQGTSQVSICFKITTLEEQSLHIFFCSKGYAIVNEISHSNSAEIQVELQFFESLVSLLQSTSDGFRNRFNQKLFSSLLQLQQDQQKNN